MLDEYGEGICGMVGCGVDFLGAGVNIENGLDELDGVVAYLSLFACASLRARLTETDCRRFFYSPALRVKG